MTSPQIISSMIGMAESINTNDKAKEAALESAITALKTYDYGSDRYVLMPLDEAVRDSLSQPKKRQQMEQQLIKALGESPANAAKEYICSKLMLVGSAASAPLLADLLSHSKLYHPACITLQAIGGNEVARTLREKLMTASGLSLLSIVTALGQLRDNESVTSLARLLFNADVQVVKAAADALGHIASNASAKALLEFQPKAPATLQQALCDACLVCAKQLAKHGDRNTARQLCTQLVSDSTPSYIKVAAQSALQALQ